MDTFYAVTNTADPASCVDRAIQWAQLGLAGAIGMRDARVNTALTEAIRQLQLAAALLEDHHDIA